MSTKVLAKVLMTFIVNCGN